MKRKLVSILIPVYMRADLAMEAIDCALSQDYDNLEIIVGDNCSTDGTYEKLCAKYGDNSKVILFQNEKNLGAVGNWERCLARAKGDYVKFLWSDDLMAENFISKAVSLLENNQEASFAYSSVILFQDTEQLKHVSENIAVKYRLLNKTGTYNGAKFISAVYCKSYMVPVSPGCAIFRRDKVHIVKDIPNKIGYHHKNNGAGIDLLMFLEALSHKEQFVYIDSPLSFFRMHPDSISVSDHTIMDGYWTAKQFYLKKYRIEKYWKPLNSEIISWTNKKKVFHRGNNIKTLAKYLDYSDTHIKKHSIFSIAIFKIQEIYYMLKN